MPKPNIGTVYALDDPRDGSTRYVGKTTQDPLERLAGHLATATNPAMRVWINALGAQGIVPRMRTITNVSFDKLDAEEQRQIERHAKAGHRLLNAPYYHQNLGDLSLPPGPTKEPADAPQPTEAVNQVARRLYGPIADGWAAGRIPVWRVVLLVVLWSPVVSAAILFRAVAGIRGFKQACLMGGGAFYLWHIGFSRIVQDFVFPRLPVSSIAHLWHRYLAQPVHTLGWHALIVTLLMGLGSYIPVAEAAWVASPRSRGSAGMEDLGPVEIAARAAAALDSVAPRALPPRSP